MAERICAPGLRPAGLDDGLYRLGRRGGGDGRRSRGFRRRALHAAGPRAGRWRALRVSRSGRRRRAGAYLRERAQARRASIGYDPKLHSPDSLDRLRSAADAAGATLVPVARNPIDEIWDDRPPIPMAKVVPQQETYTGESAASKRHRLGEGLSGEGADAVVITSPASIAWLFNVRGGDVARTPLPLGRSGAALGRHGRFVLGRREGLAGTAANGSATKSRCKPSDELQPALRELARQEGASSIRRRRPLGISKN